MKIGVRRGARKMLETKFFINGKRVSQAEAKAHWLASDTYANARAKTRRWIWHVALHGDENGNHDPNGEINHLNEAGITLSA